MAKRNGSARRSGSVTTAFLSIAITLLGGGFWWSVQGSRQKFDASNAQSLSMMRLTLAEAQIPAQGDSLENVRGCVDSLAEFIYGRSGLRIKTRIRNRLAIMEHAVLSEHAQRIPIEDLADALASHSISLLANLTDEELNYAFAVLCGVRSPSTYLQRPDELADTLDNAAELGRRARVLDLVVQAGRQLGFRPRSNAVRRDVTPELIDEVRHFKASLASSSTMRALLRDNIVTRIKKRAGSIFAATRGTREFDRVTPIEAFLIAYSVAADDGFWAGREELKSLVGSAYQREAQRLGPYREPSFAFGADGVLFSSPIDLVLAGRALEDMLGILDERSGPK